MTYIVTFEIRTPLPLPEGVEGISHKIEFVERKFPQYLCGISMTREMFKELALAEFPDALVRISDIEKNTPLGGRYDNN